MKLVMTLVVRDRPDVVDAQLAFHLNAGVDLVVATDKTRRDETEKLLRSYERDGYLHLIRMAGDVLEGESRTRLARQAATEYGADWVINAAPGEFWWPRGGGLKEVLTAIPRRYTIVQGLRRPLLPGAGAGDSFVERTIMRRSLEDGVAPVGSHAELLRPIHRADPNVGVGEDGKIVLDWKMPLRAWYPFEVFQVPMDDAPVAAPSDDASLVEDTRLRDALRTLRDAAADERAGRAFALPVGGERRLSFRAPDIVDDAAYAVECAAVGEVDIPRLEQYIAELEQRVGWLEQRLWPRVLRGASRLARRSAR